MACFLTRRARLTREISTRAQGKKHRAEKIPFLPFLPDLPLKINNKFRVANSFTQLVSNVRPVSMKKLKCKHCPIPGCHSKFLVRLANHLTQMVPGHVKYMQEAFEDATKGPYGYLFCDLKPETPTDFRLRTNTFPGETQHAYVRKV